MFRNNQYDTDCTTWAPGGKLLQVEYAMSAVSQGTPVLGVRSNTHVVLVSHKRAAHDLAEHQKKVFKIDDHMCIGIAGLTADARVLAEYMRNECLNHRYVYETPMNTGRLVAQIGSKSQVKTQNTSGKRPYGVGLLVAGVDEKGPHLYQTCPSGNYFEYFAMAIGGRSTSAKTYLEKHFEKFPTLALDELIKYGVEAMNKTPETLTAKNTTVAVLGTAPGETFYELSEAELQKFLDQLEKKADDPDATMEDAPAAAAAPAGGEAGEGGPAPMET